jgi:hypothetical protein
VVHFILLNFQFRLVTSPFNISLGRKRLSQLITKTTAVIYVCQKFYDIGRGCVRNRKKKNPSYFIWHQLPSFFFEEKQFSPRLEAKRKLYSSIEFKEIFYKTFSGEFYRRRLDTRHNNI